jgi:DNA-binding transcriptional ArsR family regulator
MIVPNIHPPPALPDPLPADLLQDTAATFGMLSATARLHIMWLLAAGECDVSTLADQVGQSVATVSHHLAKLRLAGLVRARREGKRQVYLVDDPHVVELVQLAVRHRDALRHPTRRTRGA